MNKIKAVVIDDEHFNRGLITMLITRLNENYEVAGDAESIQEGYGLITKENPSVVFLDIKMQDGSGFDLLGMFDNINFEVVFVTGFDEYALKAFEFNAVDYVLKPIDLDKFKETLLRVESRVRNNISDIENIRRMLQTYNQKSEVMARIPIHYQGQVYLLDLSEVLYVYADEGCTAFMKSPSEKFISSRQLSDFEETIGGFKSFVRINRGTYVNVNFIKSYSKGEDCVITMMDGAEHEISRRKKTEVLDLLSNKKQV